jgi:hypothetical protein
VHSPKLLKDPHYQSRFEYPVVEFLFLRESQYRVEEMNDEYEYMARQAEHGVCLKEKRFIAIELNLSSACRVRLSSCWKIFSISAASFSSLWKNLQPLNELYRYHLGNYEPSIVHYRNRLQNIDLPICLQVARKHCR